MAQGLHINHPNAALSVAVVATNPDGTGQVGPAWDYAEFLADLKAISNLVSPIQGYEDLVPDPKQD